MKLVSRRSGQLQECVVPSFPSSSLFPVVRATIKHFAHLFCLALAPTVSLFVSFLFQHPKMKHSGCRMDATMLVHTVLFSLKHWAHHWWCCRYSSMAAISILLRCSTAAVTTFPPMPCLTGVSMSSQLLRRWL